MCIGDACLCNLSFLIPCFFQIMLLCRLHLLRPACKEVILSCRLTAVNACFRKVSTWRKVGPSSRPFFDPVSIRRWAILPICGDRRSCRCSSASVVASSSNALSASVFVSSSKVLSVRFKTVFLFVGAKLSSKIVLAVVELPCCTTTKTITRMTAQVCRLMV